jgi:hypothetical protein
MKSPISPSLAEVIDELRTTSGFLANNETSYVPSFWNTLASSNVVPKPLRRPEEYAGGEYLSILCTQLDVPAKQQAMLVKEWCEAIPTFTGVRTIWFHSRVSQELFDAACTLPMLDGLWIKWNNVQSLASLERLTSLRKLYLGQSGAVESLQPISSLSQLEWLQVAGTAKASSLEPFRDLKNLMGLGFAGGDGKPIEVQSLEPLAELTQLEWLQLGALRVSDGSLRPLGRLTGLRWLGLANYFSHQEFAWLSTRLPDAACDWLTPFCRYHRSVFACPKCKTNSRVLTSGKGSKALCPSCDTERLAKQVIAFNEAVSAARHDA